MKKISFLAYFILSSTAVAEFNFGVLTGINLTNGKIEAKRTDVPVKIYNTNYNYKFFNKGLCTGYDWFNQSVMFGIDASWLHNQNKWRPIGNFANGRGGALEAYEKISVKSSPQYGIGIRIGYINGKLVPYVRLGIEKLQMKVKLLSVDVATNEFITHNISNKQSAISSALGFEYKAYDNFWLRFEGRYMKTKPFNMNYSSTAYQSDARIKISSQRILLTAGIIYRF